ncbi:mucin-20 isoform X2 [Ailuropoda melanoleuca]|uniref:Mucin 20, cell surface associated n=1 Tax=Ailuropoda melanoleuca TaxID=9646 RepID=G1LBI1_AILME|nr:mucin-20 isoform X2 [Ailuropoda melanoleuca]
MVAGAPPRMGFLWGLALPLFFCWEAGSSAGPSTSRPGPLVTTNHREEPAMTPGVRINSEGAFQTTDLVETSVPSRIPLETQTLNTQTFDRNLILASTISEAETRETKTTFPATETRAFTKRTLSKFMVVITTSMEASATSGSPMGTGMATVETVTGRDLVESVFDTLCTDDSSEEEKRITTDVLTLAHTSAEATGPALDSSAFSDSSVLAITTSPSLAPDKATSTKDLLAYNITDTEFTNCSIIEIITTATTLGTSDIDLDPTGGKALSPPEMSTLPDSTKAESHLTKTMTSAETSSAASVPEPATPDTTVEISLTANSTTEGELTTAEPMTPSTLVTVSTSPLEETSVLSVETTSHTEVSGVVTISTGTGSAVGKVASPVGPSATAYSHTHVATSKNSNSSQPSITDSTTNGPVPISRNPFPSVHLTMANSSREANITLVKTTALASKTGGKAPTALLTTAQPRWTTEATAGGDGGFLLLRLRVASPEDLTDPRVAERLMQQLCHELHTHVLPIHVSLLRIRRG